MPKIIEKEFIPELKKAQKDFLKSLELTDKQKALLDALRALNIERSEKMEHIIEDFIELYSRGNTQLDFDQKAKLCNIIILKLIYDKL